jgi:transcriptional regulator with XRE-family HTH domain/mannose-6-phosphate isomerase-like protein (cupin superfamily)
MKSRIRDHTSYGKENTMNPMSQINEPIDVGSRLRQLRKERDLSIRALARSCGLSANAISVIERGLSSPSISTLHKITEALGIPITSIFIHEGEREDMVFIRAAERSGVSLPCGLCEGMGGERFSGQMEPFLLTLNPGADSGPHSITHSGYEFIYCLDGTLLYTVDKVTFNLEKGDSLLFNSQLTHKWCNTSEQQAQILLLISSFETGEHPGEQHLLTSKLSSVDEDNAE